VSRVVRETAARAGEWLAQHARDEAGLAAGARGLALTLGRTLALALLARHADWTLRAENDPRPLAAARRFARLGINRLVDPAGANAQILASDIYA